MDIESKKTELYNKDEEMKHLENQSDQTKQDLEKGKFELNKKQEEIEKLQKELEVKTIDLESKNTELNNKDEEIIKRYRDSITVIEDARLARKYLPVMHDITEGGVLGAVYEMCELFQMGARIRKEQIPVSKTTQKICSYYHIDPLRLISSGSLLIFADEKHHSGLTEEFRNTGIDLSLIGKLTEDKDILLIDSDKQTAILPPSSDEIYKVI